MTFLQLKQRLARRRGANDSSIVTATGTRYGDAINEAQKTLLRKPGLEVLRYGSITFASVASTPRVTLPTPAIARINSVRDETNQIPLAYKPVDWLRAVDPAPTTGTPCYWVPLGTAEVAVQPSDASEVFVDSTAAGDTGIAYIEGYITGGYYRTASVTMTGTTAVSLSTSITSWIQVTKFYLSAAAVGVVTLHEDASGGTELARIAIGQTRATYRAIQLYPTPAAVVTYHCDVTRAIPDMSNNTDEPLLPEDFHDLLLDGAELRELTKQDDPRRHAIVTRRYEDGVKDLLTWVHAHPAYTPMWEDRMPERSALGAWFPAGS